MRDTAAFVILLALTATSSPAFGAAEPVAKIEFNRDIRPILSNACLKCHGPDSKQRQGGGKDGLRLDAEDSAVADLGGYAAIVRGKPDDSELMRRVTSDDPDLLMPPKASGRRLNEREVALLKQWIEQGAAFARHWSYVKPVRPAVPEVQDKTWPRNAIDSFLLARLEREGLKPSPEADRYALIRRVTLDLTGLPPTVEEVDQFVADASPDAYEKLVDRLLASDAYGEHWARLWLDLARYADSAGYADDPPRTIWALSRLRDPVAEREQAVRPVHDRANRRRPAAQSDGRAAGRHRVPSQHDDQQRRRHQRRGVPQRGRRGPREHDDGGVDGHDDGLRPVPQPQVRSRSRRRSTSGSSRF